MSISQGTVTVRVTAWRGRMRRAAQILPRHGLCRVLGARGYVESEAATELWPAVEAVLQGKQFVSAGFAGHIPGELGWPRPPQPQAGGTAERPGQCKPSLWFEGFERYGLIATVIAEGSPDLTISGQKEGRRIPGFATDCPTFR